MLSYASLTLPGTRPYNEDSLKVMQTGHGSLFLLADGLGGHGHGKEASETVVECAAAAFESDGSLPVSRLFQLSQDFLLAEQIRLGAEFEMKTTMVMLLVEGQKATIGHIGDSRVYHFQGRKQVSRTLDHSVPQMLVATGEIQEKDIRGHEDRNRLIRVMGMEWNSPKYEVQPPVALTSGDSFLLCSDGFWEWILEKHMLKTLKRAANPEEWLREMEKLVAANGAGKSMDNYSAIVVWNR